MKKLSYKLRNIGIISVLLLATGLILVHVLPVDNTLSIISLFETLCSIAIGTILLSLYISEIKWREHSDKSLIVEKEFSESMINSLPGLFFTFDNKGAITKWNKNVEIITGYNSNEIQQMDPLDFFDIAEHEHMTKAITDVFEKGESSVEANFKLKSGTIIPHFLTGKNITINGISYLVGTAVDISKRKNAETELAKSKENLEKIVNERSADLKKSNKKLESILTASNKVAIIAGDLNGTITLFNTGAENITGYKAEEVIGKASPALFFDKKRMDLITEILEENFKRPVQEHELFSAKALTYFLEEVETIAVTKEGKKINVTLNFSPIVDENNQKTGSLCVVLETTDKKTAEKALLESEKKYRMIADNVTDVIWMRGLKTFDIIYVSPACTKVFGYTPEEFENIPVENSLTKKSMKDIMSITIEEMKLEKKGNADPHRTRTFEYEAIHKNGSKLWIEVTASFVRDEEGNATGFLGVSRDVSERKNFEKELFRAKEIAESANIAKSEFLANMSHEIRTPMNAIIGMSELIMSTDMNQKQRNFLKIIRSSSKSLLAIINDILDFSKIEAGKLSLENIPLSLFGLIEEIPDIFIENIMEKELEIILNIDPAVPEHIICDPVRLRQILINLVSNAFKFTTHGQISISVTTINFTDDTVELQFCVSDTGIGFDDDIKEKLFNSFSQADGSTTRQFGGTGLGLAISKKLIEMMGGNIWAESKSGNGSSFYFKFTAGIAKDIQPKNFSIQSSLKNKKVLIVDDNPSTLEIMKLYVSSFGLKPTTADNAATAIDLFTQSMDSEQFELIIMDIKMGGMDGISASDQIRRIAGSSSPAIIIMSSTYDQESIKRMQVSGLHSFVMKPIKKSSLFDAIREQFNFIPSKPTNFEAELSSPDEFSDITVLLVEDNAINQLVASEILTGANIRVIKAGTGVEAIEILKDNQVDVVLMDIQMPEMDGLEATRVIRSGLKMSGLPIIAMTANVMEGDREECFAAGMNDYLPKPIDSKELFRLLKKNINNNDQILPVPDIKESILPEFLPGFDIEAGVKRVNGNEKIFKQILTEFVQTHADDAEKISIALNINDMETALTLCHTIKGVAGNLSAEELQEAAQNLESGMKNKQSSAYEDLMNNFHNSFNEAITSARTLKKTAIDSKSDNNSKFDISEIKLHLERLSNHLEKREFPKVEACMDTIKTHLDNTGVHNEMTYLEDEVNNMEYNNAQKALYLLAEKMGIRING